MRGYGEDWAQVVVYVQAKPKPGLKSVQVAWLNLIPSVIGRKARAG